MPVATNSYEVEITAIFKDAYMNNVKSVGGYKFTVQISLAACTPATINAFAAAVAGATIKDYEDSYLDFDDPEMANSKCGKTDFALIDADTNSAITDTWITVAM